MAPASASPCHLPSPCLPALILTGDTAPTDFQAPAHSGIPGLHKPFSAKELHDALARVC